MEHALRVVQIQGVEALEREVRFRNKHPMPLNVSHKELRQATRLYAKDELMLVATSMADTISNDLNLPPSMCLEFLRKFNEKIDIFLADEDAYKAARDKLNQNFALNEVCKRYVNE